MEVANYSDEPEVTFFTKKIFHPKELRKYFGKFEKKCFSIFHEWNDNLFLMPGLAISKPNLQIKIFETYCYNFLTYMHNQVPLLHYALGPNKMWILKWKLYFEYEVVFQMFSWFSKSWIGINSGVKNVKFEF